jgi:hypothetical protein
MLLPSDVRLQSRTTSQERQALWDAMARTQEAIVEGQRTIAKARRTLERAHQILERTRLS